MSEDEYEKYISLMGMAVDNAILHYLESADDAGLNVAHEHEGSVFVNIEVMADIAMKSREMVEWSGDDHALAGSALTVDTILSLAHILTARHLDVGVGDVFGE